MKSFNVIIAPIMIVFLVACIPGGRDTNFDGSYRLSSLDGHPAGKNITLTIDGPQISGKAQCNNYAGSNRAEWPQIDLSPLATTRRLCLNITDEDAYLKMLGQADLVRKNSDGTLDFSGPDGNLQFNPAE